jgi:hypothetical protein
MMILLIPIAGPAIRLKAEGRARAVFSNSPQGEKTL